MMGFINFLRRIKGVVETFQKLNTAISDARGFFDLIERIIEAVSPEPKAA